MKPFNDPINWFAEGNMERDLRAEGWGPEDCYPETDEGSKSKLNDLLSAIRGAEIRDGGGIIEVALCSDGSGHIDRGQDLTVFDNVPQMFDLLSR